MFGFCANPSIEHRARALCSVSNAARLNVEPFTKTKNGKNHIFKIIPSFRQLNKFISVQKHNGQQQEWDSDATRRTRNTHMVVYYVYVYVLIMFIEFT